MNEFGDEFPREINDKERDYLAEQFDPTLGEQFGRFYRNEAGTLIWLANKPQQRVTPVDLARVAVSMVIADIDGCGDKGEPTIFENEFIGVQQFNFFVDGWDEEE